MLCDFGMCSVAGSTRVCFLLDCRRCCISEYVGICGLILWLFDGRVTIYLCMCNYLAWDRCESGWVLISPHDKSYHILNI